MSVKHHILPCPSSPSGSPRAVHCVYVTPCHANGKWHVSFAAAVPPSTCTDAPAVSSVASQWYLWQHQTSLTQERERERGMLPSSPTALRHTVRDTQQLASPHASTPSAHPLSCTSTRRSQLAQRSWCSSTKHHGVPRPCDVHLMKRHAHALQISNTSPVRAHTHVRLFAHKTCCGQMIKAVSACTASAPTPVAPHRTPGPTHTNLPPHRTLLRSAPCTTHSYTSTPSCTH